MCHTRSVQTNTTQARYIYRHPVIMISLYHDIFYCDLLNVILLCAEFRLNQILVSRNSAHRGREFVTSQFYVTACTVSATTVAARPVGRRLLCVCAVGAPKIGLADGPAWYDASCAVCHSRKERGKSAPQAADRKQRRISRIGPAGPKISSHHILYISILCTRGDKGGV